MNSDGAQHPALSEMQFGTPEVLPPHPPAFYRAKGTSAMVPRTTSDASPFLSKWDGTQEAGIYRHPATFEELYLPETKLPRPRSALNKASSGKVWLN